VRGKEENQIRGKAEGGGSFKNLGKLLKRRGVVGRGR